MRMAVFIFSFFIMGLAVMPCLDADTCEDKTTSISMDSGHDHSNDKGDLCSPFCTCTCCGAIGFIAYKPVFLSEDINSNINSMVLNTPYSSSFISSYFYSFWQPPKI